MTSRKHLVRHNRADMHMNSETNNMEKPKQFEGRQIPPWRRGGTYGIPSIAIVKELLRFDCLGQGKSVVTN